MSWRSILLEVGVKARAAERTPFESKCFFFADEKRAAVYACTGEGGGGG